MKTLERCAALMETAAIVGPVNLASMLVAGVVSGLFLGLRMVSHGYYRCFFSSR